MSYTDAQGRPEIVADEELKRGPAAWRLVTGSGPEPAGAEPAGDTPAAQAPEIRPAAREAV